ncbi:MAG: hypothetical protein EOP88_24080, partial [Verrucomicrobiaceae bacterium]
MPALPSRPSPYPIRRLGSRGELKTGLAGSSGQGKASCMPLMNESVPAPVLAPLQRVMLRDSLDGSGRDSHVEQVEIRFSPTIDPDKVITAWRDTVEHTAALGIAFLIEDGMPSGWEDVLPCPLSLQDGPLPGCWESWLEEDRHRPLLLPHEVPWRAVFWPAGDRFVWTFHHALLDGRSITRVVRVLLDRLEGISSDHLSLSRWRTPDEETKALADHLFRQSFVPQVNSGSFGPGHPLTGVTAIRCLGEDYLKCLETRAVDLDTTVPTILIWAWGQAVIEMSGADSTILEQVRAGAPQPGTAGFTMALLPVEIPRGGHATLRELRTRLLELRRIESMAPEDFPPSVFPDVDGPWSSVIMIERGTPEHLIGKRAFVESISLHEAKGGSLMATAFLQPDLRLEV